MKNLSDIRVDQLRQELITVKKQLKDANDKIEKLKDGWASSLDYTKNKFSSKFTFSDRCKLSDMIKEIREL